MQWFALLLLPVVGWILLLWRTWLVGARPHHVHSLGPTRAKTDLMDHAVELFGEAVYRGVTTSQQRAAAVTDEPENDSSSSSSVSPRQPTPTMSTR